MKRCNHFALLPVLLTGLLLIPTISPLRAQEAISAPCGVVDAIDYPISDLVLDYDDFGLYRDRFGGNHTALDVGFDRWGDPVRAVARGRVTLSSVDEWDTEKGVIIVEHTFPDGSIFYALYGHVEQSDTVFFPEVGTCVERGEVIAGIGWPSRGRPHLHYEIRDFLPDEGGPGYVTGNPLEEGWYHPLDFTLLWRARLLPSYVSHVQFELVPTLPPVTLSSGEVAVASGDVLIGVRPPNSIQWRVQTDGIITGLVALPDDRVIAHTRSGQVVVLSGGRYAALWQVHGPEEPFLLLGETLVFVTDGGGLAAYDTHGSGLWRVAGTGSDRIAHFATDGVEIALGTRSGNAVTWRLIDSVGQMTYETQFGAAPLFAARAGGGWLALDGTQLVRMADGQRTILTEIPSTPGRTARLAADSQHNSYLYLGDQENTLLALDGSGGLRWRATYPREASTLLPPVFYAGDCWLYALDVDGMLNVFDRSDGTLLNQVQLYAGGTRSSSPPARLLQATPDGNLRVGSGFLTLVTFNSALLGDGAMCG